MDKRKIILSTASKNKQDIDNLVSDFLKQIGLHRLHDKFVAVTSEYWILNGDQALSHDNIGVIDFFKDKK